MSYVVLARKYRPQSFQELVGQEHVAKTLAGAIEQDRVAHAFLFTGVRGVGKTTSARLLAKCLNCLGADGTQSGPTATPCRVCPACVEIAQGTDLDVQEIDGASYNGVDEVRKLQESLPFRPARDRFKIYIVDEVHMLSQAAWNAFLKTLEEPPPHVKFLFATTEVHKVPVTILSRCQRYDFKLISAEVIASRLNEVLALEQLRAEPSAVMLLARQADGSMRDAMSLLDRVIAFCGEELREEDVARVLGVASKRVQLQLARALCEGDAAGVLQVVRAVCEDGADLVHFAREFLGVLRDLVAVQVAEGEEARRELVFAPDEELQELQALASAHKLDDLLRLFHAFSRGFDEMVRQGDVRAQLEMTLVRLSRRPPLLPLDELLARVGQLEKRVSSGGAPPGGGGGGARPRASSARAPSAGPSSRALSPVVAAGPRALPQSFEVRGSLALVPDAAAEPPMASSFAESTLSLPTVESDVFMHRQAEPQPMLAPVVASEEPAAPTVYETGHLDLAGFRAILDELDTTELALGATLRNGWLIELSAQKVTLGFAADSFYAVQLQDKASLAPFTELVHKHYGQPTVVSLDLSSRRGLPTLAVLDDQAAEAAQAEARAAVQNHPLVLAARRVLGAELSEVKIPE